MVYDDVLLSDCGKAIAAKVSDALGKAGVIRGKDKVRTLIDNQLLGVVETEDPVTGEDIRRSGIEPFHQEAAQISRHRGIDREMDHVATPPSFERRFVKAHQILRLLLDLDLAVA